MMALIEKNQDDCRDMIGLYDLSAAMAPAAQAKGPQSWVCLHQFFPDTFDAEDLLFTQDGNHIILWESALKNSIQVYQIMFSQNSISDIQLVQNYQPYELRLGLRTL